MCGLTDGIEATERMIQAMERTISMMMPYTDCDDMEKRCQAIFMIDQTQATLPECRQRLANLKRELADRGS